jgi:hypothetical protein
MIIPIKEKDEGSRYKSLATTAALCLLLFLALYTLRIVDIDKAMIYMSELTMINLSQFQPQPIEPELKVEPEREVLQAEPETQQSSAEAANAPKRVDLSSMINEATRVDLSMNRAPSTSSAAPSDARSLSVESSNMQSSAAQTLTGGNLTNAPSGRRALGTSGGGGSALGMSSGPDMSGGRRAISDGGGSGLLGGPQGREGVGKGKEVAMKSMSDFGSGYTDMKPILNRLIEWMKKNPGPLPIPVRRTMSDGRWDPNFLTSRVPFTINGRQFDLMLMVKEEQLEVHIFLVENTGATYLIDRGLQGQSSFLRRGSVAVHQGELAEVDSRMLNANVQHTQEFYQIFMSWWESVDSQ